MMAVAIKKKTKKLKTWVGIFKNMDGNFSGGNFSGESLMGGNFPGGNFPGGNLMGGNFPDTLREKRKYFNLVVVTLLFTRIVF